MDPVPSVIIYGDFNCPFSAVADARSARLATAGTAHVDWRCVEHDPTIGPNETPLTPDQRAAFDAELAQIRHLLGDDEPDRFRTPSRRLNTRDLNQLYAATPEQGRPALRSALFRAYWFDDRDLTDDAVVAAVAADPLGTVSPDRGASHDGGYLVAAWQREWSRLPSPIVPMMVLPDGYVSRGLGALARLADDSVDRG